MDAPTPPNLVPPSVSRELFDAHEKHADERHTAVMKGIDEIKAVMTEHAKDDRAKFDALGQSVAVLNWAVALIGVGAAAAFAWLLSLLPHK